MAEEKVRNENQAAGGAHTDPEDQAITQSEEHQAAQAELEALRQALEAAQAERDEYLRTAQRAQADFLNYKRNNQSARADAYEDGIRDAICALLPTIDNLERAVDAAKKSGESGALTEGVDMTLRQMLSALEKLGLSEIPAMGEAFDPECHNAVVCCSGGEPGTVQEVFQKGYRAKGRNIRCAMVRVAADE